MDSFSPRYYLGLCGIAKNETPFLREWVAYHYRIGFEKIYIYDNESSIPVRDSVSEFYDLGVCDTYTLQGEAMQNTAYNLCLRDHGHEFEWLAFFDVDEFLCLKYDTDARVLLRDYEAYSGLIVHWDLFSSSGKLSRPAGLVTQNYTQSLGYSRISKSIVKPAKVEMTITSHHFMLHDGVAVNTNREPALGSYTPIAVDKVCLNHYMYRSQQDYAEKLEKSDATYGAANPRTWASFYGQAGQRFTEREDILPFAGEMAAMLENGKPERKYDVVLADIQETPLPVVLVQMSKLLRCMRYDLAEVVFALCYKRFAHDADFLRLGISLCLKLEKTERAEEIAREWLVASPESGAYLALLECSLAAGKEAESTHLIRYLLDVAELTRDATLQESVARLQKQYPVASS